MSFLGIDVGSVSLKFVLLQGDELRGKVYLKNTGLIPTVKRGLDSLSLNGNIQAVGITGSGKEFVQSMVGADIVDSEIIAHMVACLKEYPDTKTIVDIGGEDSKLMIIKDDILSSFQMNKDCGGGTGAMIETIANRLGVLIEDVGKLALNSTNPAILPGKCGIFCQSAAVSQISKGRSVEDILMGVCKALVGNYLAVLAKGKKLEGPVVFQGATALNVALVKCFEDTLRCNITVPENCSFMGAIGVAELAKENGCHKSKFRGSNTIINTIYKPKVTFCDNCENWCELLSLYADGELIARSGSRCGKNNL